MFLSNSPWERGFFGAYGRSTGLLTYFGLSIVLFASLSLNTVISVQRIIKAFLFVGFANIVYNLLVIFGTDLFTWQNPYGKPIGTFGNPNFISSFMGMYVTALLGYLLFSMNSIKLKFFYMLQIPLSVFIIFKSGAIQGFLVLALGLTIVMAFFLWIRFKNLRLLAVYATVIFSTVIVAIAGMLQKGPLSSILYKPSVSFRGEYWAAGINMGLEKPFFGQGVDSYGTYYRVFREPTALIAPGPNTVTDTAHNVFIDIFSGSGFIGLFLYLSIILLVMIRSFKYIQKTQSLDPTFIVLISVWICYQAQTVISINQIGLAVWGWIFAGLLIGYPSLVDISKNKHQLDKVSIRKQAGKADSEPNVVSPGVAISIVVCGVVGAMIALPAFLADSQLRSAIAKSDADLVAAQAAVFPMDSLRINRIAVALARGGMTQLARDATTLATEKFPDEFAGWFTLYELTPAIDPKRAILKAKLRELDPLNPEWK
jgi:O-antigen ligase